MAFEHVNSVLLADIGSVHTRLALIDIVEGQYRFVAGARARTTAEAPLSSVNIGLDRAAQAITAATSRKLIGPGAESLFLMPEVDGHGIDEFLATASAGPPLRVLLVGLTPEMSLASAQHMLAGSYAMLANTISPYDGRSDGERVNAVLDANADLILIAGGTDAGADASLLALVRPVREALMGLHGRTPGVLFAGNRELRQQIKRLLSPHATMFYARNVRPELDEEQVFPAQIELALAYDDFLARQPGGFGEVGRLSQTGLVPTVQGAINAVRYLAEGSGRGFGPLFVDVGSAQSAIVAGVDRQVRFTTHPGLGVGHALPDTLAALTLDTVRRWLPADTTDDELWDYAHNKALRPASVPNTPRDLLIEQAVAREIVRHMLRPARDEWGLEPGDLLTGFGPIIAGGAVLTGAQHPGVAAMLLLDALQPVGVTELRLDPYNLLSGLGVTAYLKPLITVQALEGDGLVLLGTAFSPLGRTPDGADAIHVHIRPESGRTITHTVRGGEIWMAPVSPGMGCEVTLKLRRGLSLHGRRRFRRRMVAGAAGLIFDARGRPLALPRAKERAARLERWIAALSASEAPLPIPPDESAPTPEAAHAISS